jgi:hypothetical protein
MDSPRYTRTAERILELKKRFQKATVMDLPSGGQEGGRVIVVSVELVKAICELLTDAIKEIDPADLKGE